MPPHSSQGLALHFLWGDQRVAEHYLPPGATAALSVGSGVGADVAMGDHLLGVSSLDVVRSNPSGHVLRFTRQMEGELHRGGQVLSLRALVESGDADDEGDAFGLPLQRNDFVWVDLGGVVLEGSFAPVPKRVAVPWTEAIDFTALNAFLVTGFLAALFVISAVHRSVEGRAYADELSIPSARIAKLIVKPPAAARSPLVKQLDAREDAAPAARARGAKRPTRTTVKGGPDQRARAQALARKVFGPNGAGGVAILFGEKGLGNELKSAMGHVFGAAPGAAAGFGGLGLRDLGPGGTEASIGIGPIGTRGRKGRYGEDLALLTPKEKIPPELSADEPTVTGCLDKSLVRAVIKRHVSQIRYCYESHLNRFPTLAGKISAKFVIGPSGAVSSSEVAHSTVGNASLETCVTGRVRSWQFPKVKGGVVTVTYPFLFRQAGE